MLNSNKDQMWYNEYITGGIYENNFRRTKIKY